MTPPGMTQPGMTPPGRLIGGAPAAVEGFGPVVQLAVHAPDIEDAARRWARDEGAGPFYLMEHIELETAFYRGAPSRFDHSSAYGQFGDVMIELIHQHDDAPSALRDMFDARTEGLHHAAVFVEELDAAVERAAGRGMACALDARLKEGTRFVMVDARAEYGMMLEFYEPAAALRTFYRFIRRRSQGWDAHAWAGRDFLRRL